MVEGRLIIITSEIKPPYILGNGDFSKQELLIKDIIQFPIGSKYWDSSNNTTYIRSEIAQSETDWVLIQEEGVDDSLEELISALEELKVNKQDKEDTHLLTINKTIVGAINELANKPSDNLISMFVQPYKVGYFKGYDYANGSEISKPIYRMSSMFMGRTSSNTITEIHPILSEASLDYFKLDNVWAVDSRPGNAKIFDISNLKFELIEDTGSLSLRIEFPTDDFILPQGVFICFTVDFTLKDPVPLEDLTLYLDTDDPISVGNYVEFRIESTPYPSLLSPIKFTLSDESLARMELYGAAGTITGLAPGTVTLTVTSINNPEVNSSVDIVII